MRFRCLLVALAILAVASDSWGQSQRKSPARDEPKTTQQPAAPSAGNRGTEQSPAIVKIIPTPRTAEEAETDRKEREGKNLSDWWLVKLTGALAIIGTLQLFVFGWQGIQLKRSVSAAQAATGAAQAEFIATHRPRLSIRNVVVNAPKSADGREFPLFSANHSVSGQFYIVNEGGSRAEIFEGHTAVFWTQQGQLPMNRPYEGLEPNLEAAFRFLLSGQTTPVFFRSAEVLPASIRVGGNEIGSYNLYVMGWVAYSDQNGDIRRTAFCRQFRRVGGSEGRFYPVDDSDYEHEA